MKGHDWIMRKVFLSIMLLGELKATKYISDDFNLNNKNYYFPLSFIADEILEENDEAEVITVVETGLGTAKTAEKNYEVFKQELNRIAVKKHASLNFTQVSITKEFESLTFNKFFKDIAFLIKDGDKIYADITFGMKVYTLSMFIAMAYAAKAGIDISAESIIYSMKYSGTEAAENVNTAKIYDLTSLFYLNAIAGEAAAGDKAGLDDLLKFIISR